MEADERMAKDLAAAFDASSDSEDSESDDSDEFSDEDELPLPGMI